jgi:cell division protein FtsL
MTLVLLVGLGAVVLLLVGVLLGSAWNDQLRSNHDRRLADERRRLNEEWRVLHGEKNVRQHDLPESGD